MLSSRRGAIFHKIAVLKKISKILKKSSQKVSQNHKKSRKKQSIKLFKNNVEKRYLFHRKKWSKMGQVAVTINYRNGPCFFENRALVSTRARFLRTKIWHFWFWRDFWSEDISSQLRKSIPKSITFLIDFGSQNWPQIHLEIIKNPFPKPSRNHTRKNNKKVVFPDLPKPWKSCSRLDEVLFFIKSLFSKSYQKYSKKALKKHPKIMKNQ